MKRLTLGALSFLLTVGGVANTALAQTVTTNPYVSGNRPNYISDIGPVNLAQMAYRGQLKNQGIPSYVVLIQNYQARNVTAQDIVKSAIQTGMVSESALNDKGYLDAVDAELAALARQ